MSSGKAVYCAISARECQEFGCPRCGEEKSFPEYERDGAEIRQCVGCEAYFAVLSERQWQTPFPVMFTDGRYMPMSIQPHPFRV